METQQQNESAPVSVSLAETVLAQYVAENRQSATELDRVARFEFTPESPERRAIREAEEAERAERRRQSELRGRAMDLVNAAGARYRDCTFDNFQCTTPKQVAVVKALREYTGSDISDGVILYGPVGTGKDHLAFALCRAAIRSGKTVRWINGQTWFGMVRDAMDTNHTEASLVSELASPGVLCLSDPLPPVGSLTQHQATMLYRVIDGRYSRGLPTICTVNVADDAEADERMGPATWDRLCHGAWKVRCVWPTYRKPSREI